MVTEVTMPAGPDEGYIILKIAFTRGRCLISHPPSCKIAPKPAERVGQNRSAVVGVVVAVSPLGSVIVPGVFYAAAISLFASGQFPN